LFGRISLIDIIFFGLLVGLLFVLLRLSQPRVAAAKPTDSNIRYTVELQKKPPGFANKIVVGSDIYDSVKGFYIGKIIGVNATPYLEDVPDLKNQMIRRVPVQNLESVYIEVETAATVTDQTTLVGSYEILVGKEIFVRTRDIAGAGFVVALEGGRE
jgi:xanthosine utilization system XapX-like protein